MPVSLNSAQSKALQDAIAKRLGINPLHALDGISATYVAGDKDVLIEWTGRATLPLKVFETIINNALQEGMQ